MPGPFTPALVIQHHHIQTVLASLPPRKIHDHFVPRHTSSATTAQYFETCRQ